MIGPILNTDRKEKPRAAHPEHLDATHKWKVVQERRGSLENNSKARRYTPRLDLQRSKRPLVIKVTPGRHPAIRWAKCAVRTAIQHEFKHQPARLVHADSSKLIFLMCFHNFYRRRSDRLRREAESFWKLSNFPAISVPPRNALAATAAGPCFSGMENALDRSNRANQ